MSVVMVRGTSGSGKTTAIRRVMEDGRLEEEGDVVHQHPMFPTKKLVVGRQFRHSLGHKVLFHGKYSSTCGGVDTLSYRGAADHICARILEHHEGGGNSVLEGLTMSTWGHQRILDLNTALGSALKIFVLKTSLEECLESVRLRRLERGVTTPLNPKNTTSKYRNIESGSARLLREGVDVEYVDRDDLPDLILERLELK